MHSPLERLVTLSLVVCTVATLGCRRVVDLGSDPTTRSPSPDAASLPDSSGVDCPGECRCERIGAEKLAFCGGLRSAADVRSFCEGAGMRRVRIADDVENELVSERALAHGIANFWLGADDTSEPGTTRWDDGTVLFVSPEEKGCPNDAFAYAKRCFFFDPTETERGIARTTCQGRGEGWDLVEVRDMYRAARLHALLPSNGAWIGAYDYTGTGDWRWERFDVTFFRGGPDGMPAEAFLGEGSAYTEWTSAEPDDLGGSRCVVASADGWSTVPCDARHAFLCEDFGTPEPNTYAPFGANQPNDPGPACILHQPDRREFWDANCAYESGTVCER